MTVERLLQLKKDETNKESGAFEKIPFHFREISTLILLNALDDIPDGEKIRSLVEDICNLRENKVRQGIKAVSTMQLEPELVTFVNLSDVSAMEAQVMKPTLLGMLEKFYEIKSSSPGGLLTTTTTTTLSQQPLITRTTGGRIDYSTATPPSAIRTNYNNGGTTGVPSSAIGASDETLRKLRRKT
jgi:GINS complex subunit 2